MKLAGMQKLTLMDFPEVVACIIFTAGCNFLCPFCHNASIVTEVCDGIDQDEVLSFLEKRKGILEGVVITGGEPLLHHDIPEFLRKIKALGYHVKLDTNGTNPNLLKSLVNEKLVDYVAMDIKTSPNEYQKAVGKSNISISDIEETKNFLLQNTVKYEFRTTVVKGIHTAESLVNAAKWIEGAERYFLQQFKDSGNLISAEGLSSFSTEELKDFSELIKPYVKSVNIR